MKSHYPIVELGRHVRQISLRNRAKSEIEVFSVTNSEGFTRSTDYFSKEVFSKDVSNYKVVNPRQFAYNPSRVNVGSIDYLRHETSVLVSPLYIVFECNREVHADYLLRYLKSGWGNAQIRANTEGAVRDSLKFKGLENIRIPLPLLDDQIRIAHLLGRVEGLIAQRKQHLQQLDDLLKSIFLEMFGPRAIGYNDWPLVEIKDLAAKHKGAMRTGPFGSNLLHSEFTNEGDVAVLGIDNAVQNRFVWSERRFISSEKYQDLKSYRVYPADVIVTIMGTIGRSAVIPDDIPLAINTKHLAAITLNKEIANPLFVSYSIHSSPFILNQFKSKNRGAIMSGLNLGLIKETKLKRPPIELQNQFAAIHKKIDQVKSRYQQSLTDLENLYGALSRQAFKGELDLSRVPLPPDSLSTCENKQDEVETPIKSVIPESIKLKLESLNALNEKATGLKDIARAARASSLIDSKQFDIVKQAAAQLAAYRSPIEQLKNMPSIASAMEQLESTIKPLNLSQYDSIAKTAELARSMASSISKRELDWFEQQRSAALKYANAPFESMRSAMEKIESLNYLQAASASSSIAEFESLQRERLESAKKTLLGGDYSKIVPTFDTHISKLYQDAQKAMYDPLADIRNAMGSAASAYTQYLASNSLANYFANEKGYDRPLFYAEDILAILANATEPSVPFESLIDQLNELTTVDFEGYESIKAILFDLLAENQIKQTFDPENQILLFSIVENGSEQ